MVDNATIINQTIQNIINHTAPVQLPVTPMPTPIPPGVATTALDWAPIPIAPFNIPIWAILAFLSFGALIIVILHWWDMSGNLDAIKPWFIKAKEIKLGKIQVLRLSRAGNFIPDCLSIFDNILSYGESDENINQWHLNSPLGMIRIGSIRAPIVSEDWDQNRDIPTEIAVCHAADLLNSNIEKLRAELSARHKDLIAKGVYDERAVNPAELIRPIQSGLDYLGKTDENSKEYRRYPGDVFSSSSIQKVSESRHSISIIKASLENSGSGATPAHYSVVRISGGSRTSLSRNPTSSRDFSRSTARCS